MFCVRVTFLQDASPSRAESAIGLPNNETTQSITAAIKPRRNMSTNA